MMRWGAAACSENKAGMSEHIRKGYFFTRITFNLILSQHSYL